MAYDGGKEGSGVYQWIINQIPPHDLYIEAFLGGGAILRMKKPSRISLGIELNPAVWAERWATCALPGTTIICGDAFELLRRQAWPDSPSIFVYVDPPYLLETRSSQRQLYAFELMERQEHIELLTLLKQLPPHINIAISGYASALYAFHLLDWRTSSFQTVNRAGKKVTEWLWMNYPEPLELHDYLYLGKNYRERERISRKTKRWQSRLAAMPLTERYALLHALESTRSTTPLDAAMLPAVPSDVAMPAGTSGTGDTSGPIAACGDTGHSRQE